jgi:hypothetical protein
MDNVNEISSPEAPEEKTSWEMDLGIKWFSRAGIVTLLIGFAMALNYSFPYLNHILVPEVKLLIGGLVAIGLFLGGSKLFKHFQLLGRILQGGGFSLGYLTLFGMFFIPAVQIFPEPNLQSLGWGLLLLYVGGMLTFSQAIGSRSIALLSLAFGYYTASYSGTQLAALLSATLLGLASVIASRRQGWQYLSIVGLAGGLFTCLYWHWFGAMGISHVSLIPSALAGNTADELCFLALNYTLFHLASFRASFRNGHIGKGMVVLNSLLSYSTVLLIQGSDVLMHQGTVEGILALVHMISFVIISRIKSEDRALAQGQLLLSAFYALLATMGLLGAEMKPVAFAAQALLFGFVGSGSQFRKWYTSLSVLFLGAGFLTLAGFTWSLLPAMSLVGIVGMVALSALILEGTTFQPGEPVYRICLLLVSSFVFLTALMIGLQSYWITLAVVITGFTLLMGGFVSHQARYRWMGLCWIFLAAFRLFTVDLLTLETPYKIVLFLGLGVTLLAGSYGYNHLSRRTQERQTEPEMMTKEP